MTRRKTEILTPDEQTELIALSDRLEEANAQRIGYLARLARVRHTTLDAVMRRTWINARFSWLNRACMLSSERQSPGGRVGAVNTVCRKVILTRSVLGGTHHSSRQRRHDLENLAWSCQGCNRRKYVTVEALDPVTGQTVPSTIRAVTAGWAFCLE